MKNIKWIICFYCLISVTSVIAQTLPVGLLENTDDNFRRQQLLGIDTSKSSFMIRPLFVGSRNDLNLSDNAQYPTLREWNKLLWSNTKGSAELRALPIVWQQQYNTHHAYGMNDGAMIPAKGYQTFFSAGIYARLGFLSIQFRPEYVFAANKDFRQLSQVNNGPNFTAAYKTFMRTIDLPERFGDKAYHKFNWGQSSIRINFDPISLGLSNENLWWGPGIRSSLLMSNNADGFKHLTLNTTRPIKTFIGSFETQLVAGKLESSGISTPLSLSLAAKNQDWRYFSGFVFVYQPKWVPNLFLGFDRSYIIYHKDVGNGFFDYFPVFSPVEKSSYNYDVNTNADEEDNKRRDQRISFFARWVMPETKAEIYVQYGKNDHNYNLRDAILEPEHSRAYILGFKKLLPLTRDNEYIQVGIEATELEPAAVKTIRGGVYWYNHTQVLQGYTNNGQVIGAGIGSASNLQALDVSWIKGLKRIGFQAERIVRNNELFYKSFGDARRHWIDLGFTGKFDWDYKGFLLNAQLAYIRSLNYQYTFEDQQPFFWDWDKQDINNFHFKMGVMYRF